MTGWGLKGEPYLVQQEALSRCDGKRGYGFFIDRGLGKTAITFADFIRSHMRDEVDYLVILCPSYLAEGWGIEAAKWGLKFPFYCWPNYPKNDYPFIMAINFESILYSGGRWLEKWLNEHGDRTYLVADESSNLKKATGKWSITCRLFSRYARYRRILTGTPVVQGPHDLWGQLKFIGALNGVKFTVFKNRFCVMGGYMGKQILGSKNEQELGNVLRPIVFEARKEEWAKDLPEKIYQTIHLEMTPAQKTAYDKLWEDFYLEIGDSEVSPEQAINMQQKVQQVSGGYVIDDDKIVHELVKPEKNPLFRAALEIQENTRGKIIYFVFHKHMLKATYDILAQSGYNPAMLGGHASMRQEGLDTESEKKKFNDNPSCRSVAVQIQAGKFGHTLLGGIDGDRCSTSIYIENSYSLEDRLQSEDRNHRFGQDKAVTYIDPIMSPIGTKIARALQRKEDVAKVVLDHINEHRN